MQNLQFTGSIFGQRLTLKQVQKRTAKRLYNEGVTIYLQSSKFHPFGVWSKAVPIEKAQVTDSPLICERYNSFDDRINSFEYYNCSSEAGLYTHFYIAI